MILYSFEWLMTSNFCFSKKYYIFKSIHFLHQCSTHFSPAKTLWNHLSSMTVTKITPKTLEKLIFFFLFQRFEIYFSKHLSYIFLNDRCPNLKMKCISTGKVKAILYGKEINSPPTYYYVLAIQVTNCFLVWPKV